MLRDRESHNSQSQSQSNTTPQSLEFPIQAKCCTKRYWHSNSIIAEEIHPATNLLSAKTSQKTIAICCQGIEELEGSTEGENAGYEIDNTLVVCEELGDNVAEEDNITHANNTGSNHGLLMSVDLQGMVDNVLTTLALVLAASERVAPIRFATRVDAAIDRGKGIWNVRAVSVLRTL
jgi:hypothetical protein